MAKLLSFSINDVTGYAQVHKIFLDDAVTLTEVSDFVTAYAPLLDAVTGGAIDSAKVTIPVGLPIGLKSDPMDDYFNRHGGNLSFSVVGSSYRETLFVPAYLRTLFSGEEISNVGATADLVTYILGATDAQVANAFDFPLDGFIVGRLAKRAK